MKAVARHALAVAEQALLRPVVPGPPGPPGPGIEVDGLEFYFDTPSPLILTQLHVGDVIVNASIAVEVPFNGIHPCADLGTLAHPSLMLSCNDTDLRILGQFGSIRISRVEIDEFLQLTIDSAGSTAGVGYLLFSIKRA